MFRVENLNVKKRTKVFLIYKNKNLIFSVFQVKIPTFHHVKPFLDYELFVFYQVLANMILIQKKLNSVMVLNEKSSDLENIFWLK